MNDLVAVPNSTALDAPLHPDDAAAVSQDKRNSKAANTQRAYRAALSDSAKSEINAKRATTHRKYPTFTAWCADRGYPALPSTPAHVAAYLSALARMRASVPTIEQRRSAIAWAHRAAGLTDPCVDETVRAVVSGIKRTANPGDTTPRARPIGNGKAPISVNELRRMVAALRTHVDDGRGAELRALRDVAVLLIGFMGAFRRSELVARDISDISVRDVDGVATMRIAVRYSKSDQTGEGKYKNIPSGGGDIDPVAAYHAWINAAAIGSGPVFRGIDRWGNVKPRAIGGQDVADIVHRAAALAGLSTAQFGAHSMRSGFATAAADKGVSMADTMEQTGHASAQSFLRYVKQAGKGSIKAVRAVMGE